VAYLGPRRRRRGSQNPAAPRRLGCLWPLFWFVLLIVLLGLIFGGYRKGTRVGAPQFPVGDYRLSMSASGSAQGSAASQSVAN
jgi:hypothetical protein